MVNPVMRGRILHPFRRTKLANQLCMQPRLIGENDDLGANDHHRRKTHEQHRNVDDHSSHAFKRAKADCSDE